MTYQQEDRLRNLVLMVLWFGFGFYLFGFINQILLMFAVLFFAWIFGILNIAKGRQ